jgi:hypothetical protein
VGSRATVAHDEVITALVAFAGDANIVGGVTGDVLAIGGDVWVSPAAVIHGSVVSLGGEVHVQDGASIAGNRVRLQAPTAPSATLALAATGLLAAGLAPRVSADVATDLRASPARHLFRGLVWGAVSLTSAALFTSTVVGVPVALAVIAAAGAAMVAGLGGLLRTPPGGLAGALGAGVALTAASTIPGVGPLVPALTASAAIGAGVGLWRRAPT